MQKGQGGIATHVERKSRYLIAARLSNGKAATMTDQTIGAFRSVPMKFRHTLTVDNGKEFADFKTMEKKIGISIYFADPYTPYQRATNKNSNGLVRQYFPKGSDFSTISSGLFEETLCRTKGS